MNSVKRALVQHLQEAFRGMRYVPGHVDHGVVVDLSHDTVTFISVADADGNESQCFTISITEHRRARA